MDEIIITLTVTMANCCQKVRGNKQTKDQNNNKTNTKQKQTKQTNKRERKKKKKRKKKRKGRPVLPNPLRSVWPVQPEVQNETTKTVAFTTASACKQGMCCNYDELYHQGRKNLPASPSSPWKTVTTQHTTAGRVGMPEDRPKLDTVEKVMKTTCAPSYHRLITLFLCLAVPPCPALSRKRRASL